MKFIPHDYQRYAVDFITSHSEAAVLLDMGLGPARRLSLSQRFWS